MRAFGSLRLLSLSFFGAVLFVSQASFGQAPNQPPSCTLSVTPSSGYVPLNVFARGNCTAGSNPISSYTLDFGDGTVVTGTTSQNHTYQQTGSYTVTLTATDTGGMSGSASQPVTVKAVPPPQTGDVYVGIANSIGRFDRSGSQEQSLTTSSGPSGLAFDSAGNLYAAEDGNEVIEKFDPNGKPLGTFGSGLVTPESLVFDAFGNVYVGEFDSAGRIAKLDSSGNLLAQYTVAVDNSSSDLWVDLAPDECTVYYTSAGTTVKRFDVCKNAQLSDFASGLPGSAAKGLHIRPNGEVLVADTNQLVRLGSTGSVLQTYIPDANDVCNVSAIQWVDLSLDPDGSSFWATERCNDLIYHFDIASGSVLSSFQIPSCDCTIDGGIVIRGEVTAAANQPPSCTLQVNPNQGAAPFTTTATGSCTDPENDITSTSLNWGDGTVVNDTTSGSHTYSAAGTYTVTVMATDRVGQTGSASQTVTVINGSITCSLSIDSPGGAAPHTINATGTCSANDALASMTINWGDNTPPATKNNFDGATQGTFTAPPHTYSSPGTYTVTLTGQNASGQTSTDSKTVTVFDSTPQCRLSPNGNQGLAPFTATFNGNCTDAGNDISSGNSTATLNFGDNTAPQQVSTANGGNFSNISHVYQSPGTYTATYTVTDDSGHTGTANSIITVSQNQPPTCTLTLDKNTGTAPLTVNATANCNDPDNENVNTASIDWGDGSAPQSLNCDGSCFFRGPHTYTAPGTYMVVVTGTDAGGLTGSANQTVTVTQPVDSTPKCSLNSDSQNGAAPFTVTFSGSCQDAGNDLGAGSAGTLNFGDNSPMQQVSPASFSNVSHVYQTPGTYTATFTATDSTQHTGTSSLTIMVTTPVNSTPMCTLNSDKQSGPAPLTVSFTGSCSDAGNDLLPQSEKIDFGDGTPAQSGTNATHTYTAAGSYIATLSASDSHGNSGSTSQTITVSVAQAPNCTLSVSPSTGPVPLSVTATGNCTAGSSPISSSTLNFGDGTVQSATSGSHSYVQAGNYTVTVTATDQNGLQGSASQAVVATAPVLPPSCTLSVSPNSGITPLSVTATGNCTAGSNPISSTTLDFGDGTTVNASSGTHTYLQAGIFTAKITATDSIGLSGSAVQTVTVAANNFPIGVFVGIREGSITQFAPDGTVLKTLNTGLGGTVSGMAFDSAGNLYATDFTAGNVSKFDLKSGTLIGTFGSAFDCQPESMVFDGAGNAYVGLQGCARTVLKFGPSGNFLASFPVATEEQGGDDVDLSADQCTLLYTSEGPSVLRYDVCRNQQMSPFATGLKKTLMLRILPDGGVIVGDLLDIVHLNASGQQVMTYTVPGEQCLFAIALDPDGTSFWAADFCSSNIYRFDIATGRQISKFNTGTPSGTVFGLAIAGTGLNVAGLGNGGRMTASPTSATLAAGQSATFTVSFTSDAAAAGKTLTLSCAGLPAGLSCSFTPPAITLGAAGTTTTATLTIARTITTALLHLNSPWLWATWTGFVPALVLMRLRRPHRRGSSMLWLGVIVAGAGIWASCGGGGTSRSSTPQPTPQGTYTVIVVGTTSGAQASTTINVTLP